MVLNNAIYKNLVFGLDNSKMSSFKRMRIGFLNVVILCFMSGEQNLLLKS